MGIVEIKAPNLPPEGWGSKVSVFLAGSIEQGAAREWQAEVVEALSDLNIIVFNPRRDVWDPSLPNTLDCPEFVEQVNWELKYLHSVDYVLFYFDPGTVSPISLLELGMCLPRRNFETVVCCPEGYGRKGNVDITCDFAFCKRVEELDRAVDWIRWKVS